LIVLLEQGDRSRDDQFMMPTNGQTTNSEVIRRFLDNPNVLLRLGAAFALGMADPAASPDVLASALRIDSKGVTISSLREALSNWTNLVNIDG
jgi:hypothetical protein